MSETFVSDSVDQRQVSSEEELRRSEQRFRALVEASPQTVWTWGSDSPRVNSCRSNVWWEQVTGQSLEEQMESADAWLRVVHPEDRDRAGNTWADALSKGITFNAQYRVRAKVGGWRHIQVRGVPVHDNNGIIREWVGTLDDVTLQFEAVVERERLLADVESERQRLEQVFQFSPAFMAILRGPNHVFERVNDRYLNLIGGRDVIGQTVRDALPEIEGQGYFELLDQVYNSGVPYVCDEATAVLRNPDGMDVRTLQFSYQPMFDASGQISGVVVQGVDLTSRRKAETGLASLTTQSEWQQRLYETLLSNTSDFLYLFDRNSRFTYVNKALLDLWGKTLPDVLNLNFFELDYDSELAERLHQQVLEVVASGKSQRDETLYTSSQGTRAYEYIFMPVFGADGCVEAVAGSTRDITARKATEDALRESEQRHRALINASSEVVYRMSADWSTMQPIDGRDLVASNELQMHDWMERNTPETEHTRIRSAIADAIANRSPFELEHQVVRADGSLGWTISRAIPILNAQGEIDEWFGIASDVTRRKQAEAELMDIRSRMEAALEAGAIGTWSWDVTSDKFFGDGSFARLFSLEQSDVAGGPLRQIVNSLHPDDRDRVLEVISRAIKTGERFESSYRIAKADGGWRWVNARGQAIREANGSTRFPGVIIDITDRVRAEEQLALLTDESSRRTRLYETILSNTPDLAYVFDLSHRFVYANEVLLQMWGRSWSEAIGKTCLELGYEPWHAEMHDREIEEVKRSGKPIRGEVPFHGTFGRRVYEYIFVPIFDTQGNVEAVAGTTRDVTERKAAEEALREADRKKDDFIALLAHELRNPLAPIRTGLQVMRLAEGDRCIIADAQSVMERQLAHMVRLIDDLLDVSRITRNKMELRLSRISLADIVKHAVEAASPTIQEFDHALAIELPSEAIMIDADLTRMAQVFSNLLTNASKYMERGGKIWLSAMKVEDFIEISVRDQGIGIPKDALPMIFDMFSQVDRSAERSSGGLGIGLALVRGLVEMHGGSVAASSVENCGSTFTVRLPLPVADEAIESESVDTKPTASIRRRVLVVDDNRDGAKLMAMMLQIMGSEVETSHDGLEAVEKAQEFRPEIILMDIGLPGLNGLEATRRIREMDFARRVTIIALTGWGQESDRMQSHAAGCDGHLVKPVNIADLEKLLKEVPSR